MLLFTLYLLTCVLFICVPSLIHLKLRTHRPILSSRFTYRCIILENPAHFSAQTLLYESSSFILFLFFITVCLFLFCLVANGESVGSAIKIQRETTEGNFTESRWTSQSGRCTVVAVQWFFRAVVENSWLGFFYFLNCFKERMILSNVLNLSSLK